MLGQEGWRCGRRNTGLGIKRLSSPLPIIPLQGPGLVMAPLGLFCTCKTEVITPWISWGCHEEGVETLCQWVVAWWRGGPSGRQAPRSRLEASPSSSTFQLCDLGKVTSPLWAQVPPLWTVTSIERASPIPLSPASSHQPLHFLHSTDHQL